jgi:hypothetical protein
VSGGVKRGARRGFWQAIGEFSEELLRKTFVDAGLFSHRTDPASNPLQNSSASAPQQALASSWLIPFATLGSCCVGLSYCMGLATRASAANSLVLLAFLASSPGLPLPHRGKLSRSGTNPSSLPVPARRYAFVFSKVKEFSIPALESPSHNCGLFRRNRKHLLKPGVVQIPSG